jgi:hypothetical protein
MPPDRDTDLITIIYLLPMFSTPELHALAQYLYTDLRTRTHQEAQPMPTSSSSSTPTTVKSSLQSAAS